MNPFEQISPGASSPPSELPQILWGGASLAAASPPSAAWLWQGYLAPGALTLLTSQWKAGKTTLLSVLLARMKAAGQLAGRPLAAGRAVVVTEEPPSQWQRRHLQLHFGDHIGWCCRPFGGTRPSLSRWSDFLDGLAAGHALHPFDLLVIDPLASFLPGSENEAGSMLAALLPLQRLTSRNVSALVLHHPPKGRIRAGQAARGSGALSGHADILIEMRSFGKAEDRRRRLWAFSRFPDTPRQLVIEWAPDGTDYLAHGTFLEDEFARHWQSLRHVFDSAPHWLTRKEVLTRWTTDNPPDKNTLIRWLELAVSQGLLKKDGKGLRNHPLRYWLPEQEEIWRNDPIAPFYMPELFPNETRKPSPAPKALSPREPAPPESPSPTTTAPASPPESPSPESPSPCPPPVSPSVDSPNGPPNDALALC